MTKTPIIQRSEELMPTEQSLLHEIKLKLQSEEFKQFLKSRLGPALTHPLLTQERISLPEAAEPDDYDHDSEDWEDFEEEFNIPAPIKRDTEFWNYTSKPVLVAKDFIRGKLKYKLMAFRAGTFSPFNAKRPQENPRIGHSFKFYHDGVIAGGAIAALANEFLYQVPAVINDIDYFYYSNGKFHDLEEMNKVLYEHLADSSVESYGIVSSCTDGDLNLIKIQPDEDPQRESFNWKKLLSSFDLNCCMIAVHPVSLELYFSESFLQFLAYRKIDHVAKKVFNLSNIIRGKRKSQELSARYYLGDQVRKLILNDLKSIDDWGHESCFIYQKDLALKSKNKYNPLFVAKKDRKTLKLNPALLAPYFTYQEKKNAMSLTHSFPILDYFKLLVKEKLVTDKQLNYHTLDRSFKIINKNFPIQEVSKIYYQRLITIRKAFNEFKYRFEPSYLPDHISFDTFALLLKQDLNEASFLFLINKLKGHDQLFPGIFILLQAGWMYPEIEGFYRRMLNTEDGQVGILENLLRNHKSPSYKVNEEDIPFDFKTMRVDELTLVIDQILMSQRLAKAKKNILRQKESFRYFNKLVSELTTMDELSAEGKRMHHCVGGYSETVRNNSSRIFHLKLDSVQESTLELCLRNQGYTIRQNKMVSNQAPTENLTRLARLFTKFLNHRILKQEA